MSKSNLEAADIAKYISSFLCDYAPSQLTNSENTLRGYETTLTLYIGYLEDFCGISASSFSKKCFEQAMIEAWLKWLSLERGCSPETCNNRLSSLRSFIKYLASRGAKYLYLKSGADNVPLRKTAKKKLNGLTRDAVTAILAEPDQHTKTGARDLTLLTVLYGTAARIDEILSMKIKNLRLDSAKPYVNIIGKGDKIRTLYLPPRAVAHLRQYICIFHGMNPAGNAFVFYSRNAGPDGKMSQAAIRKMLRKYAAAAHEKCPDVPLDLHAHQFRHAKATHWLEDGVNIVQISFLLGHEQLDTTMRYLDITTEQEVAALSTLEEERHRNIRPKWNPDKDSLAAICSLRKLKNNRI
jgi:site-specific recombinase XerD